MLYRLLGRVRGRGLGAAVTAVRGRLFTRVRQSTRVGKAVVGASTSKTHGELASCKTLANTLRAVVSAFIALRAVQR